jgi:hypothetical protein
MEPRVAYLAMLILPLHFNDIFLLSCLCIFEVCLWVKYDNVVLRCLPMFRLHCTFRLTLWRISRTFIWTFPCYKQSLLKSMLSLLWHANKARTFKTIHMKDLSSLNVCWTKLLFSDVVFISDRFNRLETDWHRV